MGIWTGPLCVSILLNPPLNAVWIWALGCTSCVYKKVGGSRGLALSQDMMGDCRSVTNCGTWVFLLSPSLSLCWHAPCPLYLSELNVQDAEWNHCSIRSTTKIRVLNVLCHAKEICVKRFVSSLFLSPSVSSLKMSLMIYKTSPCSGELLRLRASFPAVHCFTSCLAVLPLDGCRMERWQNKKLNRHVSALYPPPPARALTSNLARGLSFSHTTDTNWQHVSWFTNQTSSFDLKTNLDLYGGKTNQCCSCGKHYRITIPSFGRYENRLLWEIK